jgi:hypothetical protein
MPVKGFKAITVSDDFYTDIKRFYDKHKNELKKRGVTSLPSCLHLLIYEGIRQYEQTQKPREDLKNIMGEAASRLVTKLNTQKK